MADLGGRPLARLTPRPSRRARHRPQGAPQAQTHVQRRAGARREARLRLARAREQAWVLLDRRHQREGAGWLQEPRRRRVN
ncbi:Os06g0620000 [Oryza sativa Japonica Group]|uniref:Os06g0620000 protein n=2 Tax=Oryza sativa subsp. japonica TaxID=39947 RepID=B9FU65_ORYSJ|nr:hypothetical protein OsJ_21992 [Oryza sativa Japonica Group]KAB8103126.1 hypothetical protein EE612_035390 [Oryza sativa]BAD35352.1 unknown protein [Oryza sativa Japonica Group]BAD35440.1 unknown protein [Oryza sativa Japonica Group]BAF20002.1 Os06g0620000 [Oryza sativa Japonica Group]|eukprot:NP_001058088.1 Os06g0620000 [Oryza sativa Japonica Group]